MNWSRTTGWGRSKTAPPADELSWHAVAVPGDRNATCPEMTYVHRYWLRTRVTVPAESGGPLVLPARSLGEHDRDGLCQRPAVRLDQNALCRLGLRHHAGRQARPDQRDLGRHQRAFYGLANADNAKHPQYMPYDFWHYNATNQLDMPVLSHFETGLLLTPSLVVAGQGLHVRRVRHAVGQEQDAGPGSDGAQPDRRSR